MKQLVIIGAGGMGRTVYDLAVESIGYGTEYTIKGFIDDNLASLECFPNYHPMLGTISDYQPAEDELFICSIGGASRRKCMETIIAKGGAFLTMIHRTARIGTNVVIGAGTIVGAFTAIGSDAQVGKYNLIQSQSIIGHDSIIGDWNRIDTHVTLVGGTIVKDNVNIYTGATINHNVVIESNSNVAAMSFVIRKVKSGITVMGNPATKLF